MIQDFIKKYNIKQIYESSSINSLNLDMKYENLYENTIFYGVYTEKDIGTILNHRGKKWILWAGQDANIKYKARLEIINLMKSQNIESHLVKDTNVEQNLLFANVIPININNNLELLSKLDSFLINNDITQVIVSAAIDKPIIKTVEIDIYKDKEANTLFYGIYNIFDISRIKSHKGKKWVLWAGNDANIEFKQRINVIKAVNDLKLENILVTNDSNEDNMKSLGYDVLNIEKKYKLNIQDIENIQIKVSSHITNFENKLVKRYNLKEYKSKNLPTLFVGLYDLKDVISLNAHKGTKYLLWGGKDTNFDVAKFKFNLLGIENINDINHIAFCDKIYSNLMNQYITSKVIKLDDIDLLGKSDLLDAKEENIRKSLSTKFDNSILINSSSNLNLIAGDTIWMSNLCNTLNCKITIITKYELTNDSFIKNIENPDNIDIKIFDNIVDFIDINIEKFDSIIIRNNELLDAIKNKGWLNKTTIYGLDVHLNGVKNLNNKFKELWTQSEKLKQLFIDNEINEKKIVIKEPYAYKYNFDLPERKDNEIRLIYCGTLRDEENILEIIEEFQKIHKERPEVVLKIVYGKFHGNKDFILKVSNHIKNGVDGITFKTKLSHKDACYEIATSDIGICWRKNGWGDNGEISTKVKEYESYGLTILGNNLNIKSKHATIYFKSSSDFNNILLHLANDDLINRKFQIIYLANTSLPDISGYTIRTKYILNEINKYYSVICFVKPDNILTQTNIYSIDNIIYYKYHNRYNYEKFLENYISKNNHINFIWSASDNFNGIISGNLSAEFKIKSAYEIRGFWHYSRKYREECNNKFNSKFFNYYNLKEKKACQLNDYVLCENNMILNICHEEFKIKSNNLITLPNGYNSNNEYIYNNLNNKKKLVFGYIGSIVSYEGLQDLITAFKKINFEKYNTELLIIGGGSTIDALKTIDQISKLTKDSKYIKYLGKIPFEQVEEYYNKIDIICLPRKDCLVCNTVAPLKPYEAMSYSKIILASDVDAISEIVKHNENGLLFNKKNPNSLYDLIIDILNKKYDLDMISKNGFNYVKKHTWAKSIDNVLSILKKTI